MAFDIDIGYTSLAGRKPENEDFCAAMLPAPGQEDMGVNKVIRCVWHGDFSIYFLVDSDWRRASRTSAKSENWMEGQRQFDTCKLYPELKSFLERKNIRVSPVGGYAGGPPV